jgi:peptidoglycan/LPS O-acetylase OafA/YrhL
VWHGVRWLSGSIWAQNALSISDTTNVSTADTFSQQNKLENVNVFMFYLLVLVVGAALYAHLVEEPLVRRFREVTDRWLSPPRARALTGDEV